MTKDYQLLPGTEEETSIDAQNIINTNQPKEVVDHKIIFAAACLDVIANFALTIGFFYVGSGVRRKKKFFFYFYYDFIRSSKINYYIS